MCFGKCMTDRFGCICGLARLQQAQARTIFLLRAVRHTVLRKVHEALVQGGCALRGTVASRGAAGGQRNEHCQSMSVC